MKRLILAALACALLAGCGGGHGSPTVRPPSQPIPPWSIKTPTQHCMPQDSTLKCNLPPAGVGLAPVGAPVIAHGVDFAWGGPTATAMRSRGFAFGASYLSFDAAKNWSATQVASYARAGIARVFVWETTATRALDGHPCAAGAGDARVAAAQGARLGARVIYFAVDFELQAGEYTSVASYFRCAGSILGLSRTGAYGGVATCALLFSRHLIRYCWQTYAWSGGRWDPRAQLQQYQNGSAFDYDRAVAKDYGQTPFSVKPNRPALLKLRAVLRGDLTRHACWKPPHYGRGAYHRVCGHWRAGWYRVNRELG